MAELVLAEVGLHYHVRSTGARGQRPGGANTGGAVRRFNGSRVEVTALKGINLSAHDGDRIGILGHNGAGKTTLLRVVAGTIKPDTGRIRRCGKTIAILNPATGLNPTLSGYENIEQIGLLSGLSRHQLAELLPDVAEFTELGEFLSLPVETYSAGMKARLAFGVATGMHPEILIADENIGTGDAQFMDKASARMEAMMNRSSILLLATHSLSIIEQFCNRAILLRGGSVIADGDVESVIAQYKENA